MKRKCGGKIKKYQFGNMVTNPVTPDNPNPDEQQLPVGSNPYVWDYNNMSNAGIPQSSLKGDIKGMFKNNTGNIKGSIFNVAMKTLVGTSMGQIEEASKRSKYGIETTDNPYMSFKNGGKMKRRYANGGMYEEEVNSEEDVPVEVEGGEVVEYPNGEIEEVEGNRHEQGGVKTDLPEGTMVYSDRIKVGNQTLAERKLQRDEKIKNLQAQLTSTRDIFLKNNMKRTLSKLAMEEAQDEILQEEIGNQEDAQNQEEETQEEMKCGGKARRKLAGGGRTAKEILEYQTNSNPNNPIGNPLEDTTNSWNSIFKNIYQSPELPTGITGLGSKVPSVYPPVTPKSKTTLTEDLTENMGYDQYSPELSTGDKTAIASRVGSNLTNLGLTFANRLGDKENRNFYKNYGIEGLRALENTKNIMAQQKNNMKRTFIEQNNTLRENNRGSARGINTLRALDVISDSKLNKNLLDTDYAYNQTTANLTAQESQQRNLMDEANMKGEESRFEKDKLARDNYHKNLSEHSKEFGRTGEDIGNIENQRLKESTQMNLYSKLYGFEDYDFLTGEKRTPKINTNSPLDRQGKDEIGDLLNRSRSPKAFERKLKRLERKKKRKV